MALRDELLNPIAGDNPSGADVRYDPVFDRIKEARREDDDVPQGEWATERKVADWPGVIKSAKETLATKSKDLQLAVWLTEALMRRDGFGGLREGLDLLTGMVSQFWDTLYPEIDDGDAEMRAAPLEWLGNRLDYSVRMVPLDRGGFNLNKQKEGRTVPDEAAAAASSERAEARATAVADGKVTPEELEEAFTSTPKAWFRGVLADVQGSLEALKALDDVSSEKFGDVAPSFARLKDVLEEVARLLTLQIKRKLETDPDPVDETAADGEMGSADVGDASSGALAGATGGALTPEPTSPTDAASRIAGAAKFLRKHLPLNPGPYLLLRGFRWGELRATSPLDPRLLEAPPTQVRSNLKGMLLDGRWPELLEGCENVMATPQGRGWLDLQRYVLTACEGLGSDYDAIAASIRSALRALLSDVPQLIDMTLMDDTATANAETRAWLELEVLAATPVSSNGASEEEGAGDGAESSSGNGNGTAPARRYEFDTRFRDPVTLAHGHARAGRAERAIALLMRETAREKSRRGRFVLSSQLASIMVGAGHETVAQPILEELAANVEEYKLEEWESGEVVATPLSLLYQCLEKTEGDSERRQALYLRICRLDPIQAIGLGPR